MIFNLERASLSQVSTYNKVIYDIKERPFLLLYEYVPSLSLYDFGINRSQEILKKGSPQSRQILMSLGKILAVDIFFNNHDRMPWLWDNPGNPNNILFGIDLDYLPPNVDFKDHKYLDILVKNSIAIDTKPNCLDPSDKVAQKNLAEYMNTLGENLKEFFYEMKNIMIFGRDVDLFEYKCFAKLIEFINNSCGYILNGLNLFHVAIGFILTLNDIIKIELEEIQVLIEFVQTQSIIQDWADVFKSNAKLLNIQYFKYILNLLKVNQEENEEIFKWVIDVTASYYSTEFKTNLQSIIDSQSKLKYELPKPKKEEKKKKVEEKKPEKIINIDQFNMNDKDKKTFSNDVHNGIYDLYAIDDTWLLDVKKREYAPEKNVQKVDIPNDIKKEDPNKNKKTLDIAKVEELDPHHVYTLDELKDKIKRDELKQTLFMKKKFNPDEAKFLEEKIKNVDESFLEEMAEDEKHNKLEEDKKNKEIENRKKSEDKKEKTDKVEGFFNNDSKIKSKSGSINESTGFFNNEPKLKSKKSSVVLPKEENKETNIRKSRSNVIVEPKEEETKKSTSKGKTQSRFSKAKESDD